METTSYKSYSIAMKKALEFAPRHLYTLTISFIRIHICIRKFPEHRFSSGTHKSRIKSIVHFSRLEPSDESINNDTTCTESKLYWLVLNVWAAVTWSVVFCDIVPYIIHCKYASAVLDVRGLDYSVSRTYDLLFVNTKTQANIAGFYNNHDDSIQMYCIS